MSRTVNAFIASVRDIGDPALAALALRVYWRANFPRVHARTASDADMAVYAEWRAEHGY